MDSGALEIFLVMREKKHVQQSECVRRIFVCEKTLTL